ncbi:hypothetical protein QN382_06235 [Pseudomonas sp. 10B1]|uniref:hypothetical protein n=1 Tax=unclassified Pseudomonas TaxID=196821 RepID=UPI002AB577C6|nr:MULTISPECIES: hypothetical protein [unclassified Pseudomonas]MDY7563041.1 hypothetical protein [Pseudomonas sp. AB6]MEA9996842.1 hypothetical protein [Pseudomonas sp. AA4]MEB0085215.1 hypothetical protein [Pseudomonas sp. RTI1]MEB0125318.1 hypothetical protein [Pseudomonas sp. CCC1.2]MEB0153289.1 hypothetical protein [Pseudomonas sp. CCC4.3]
MQNGSVKWADAVADELVSQGLTLICGSEFIREGRDAEYQIHRVDRFPNKFGPTVSPAIAQIYCGNEFIREGLIA